MTVSIKTVSELCTLIKTLSLSWISTPVVTNSWSNARYTHYNMHMVTNACTAAIYSHNIDNHGNGYLGMARCFNVHR